jgi:hypothetical protein
MLETCGFVVLTAPLPFPCYRWKEVLNITPTVDGEYFEVNRIFKFCYFSSKRVNYTEEERRNLKKMCNVLMLQFHSDCAEENKEVIKLVTRVKGGLIPFVKQLLSRCHLVKYLLQIFYHIQTAL